MPLNLFPEQYSIGFFLKGDMEEIIKRIENLESELNKIAARNMRVEAEKAWEVSRCRIGIIVAITYCITALVFWLIQAGHPLLNALIPTVGYYLSTQTLPLVKEWWFSKY